MNARVLLLVLLTGLFMAAWDGDQTAMQAALARRDERQAASMLALAQQPDGEVAASDQLTHNRTVMTTVSTHDTIVQSQSTPVECVKADAGGVADAASDTQVDSVPLPPGIAAGDYQAVNQSGKTVRLTVLESAATGSFARDFYTVDANDGNRWYLIRIAASK